MRAAGRVASTGRDQIGVVGCIPRGPNHGLIGIDIRGTLEWLLDRGGLSHRDNPTRSCLLGSNMLSDLGARSVVFAQYFATAQARSILRIPRSAACCGVFHRAATAAHCRRSATPALCEWPARPIRAVQPGRDTDRRASLMILVELSSTLSLVQNLNDGPACWP